MTHGDIIKAEQDGYFYLLRRYLETQLPSCQATEVTFMLMHLKKCSFPDLATLGCATLSVLLSLSLLYCSSPHHRAIILFVFFRFTSN